jgi:hypothetical protein
VKQLISLTLILVCFTQWSLADILYTKKGEAISGKVESITSEEVVFRIPRGGFESEVRHFSVTDILEILDDQGQPIQFIRPPEPVVVPVPPTPANPTTKMDTVAYRFSLTKTYSRWPLLVGTAAFTTIGVIKLSRAASEYRDIRRDEDLGYEVTARKNDAGHDRLWGELSIAAGVVCLVLALTPEKVRKPVLESFHLRDDGTGICYSFSLFPPTDSKD